MALFSLLVAPEFSFPANAQAKQRMDHAQEKVQVAHKIVMEVTADGVPQWEAALRNAKNIQNSFGVKNTRIEIVTQGKGIGLLLAKNSQENPALKAAIQQAHDSGIILAACNNTMKRFKIAPKELLQVAVIFDSALAEIVRKQEAGWAYLKIG